MVAPLLASYIHAGYAAELRAAGVPCRVSRGYCAVPEWFLRLRHVLADNAGRPDHLALGVPLACVRHLGADFLAGVYLLAGRPGLVAVVATYERGAV